MKAATRPSALVALSVLLGAALCGAQNFSFVEPAGAGLEAYTMAPGMGGGVAAVDYDDDGDVDLFSLELNAHVASPQRGDDRIVLDDSVAA